RRVAATHRIRIRADANAHGCSRGGEHPRVHRRQAAPRPGSLMATVTSIPPQERLTLTSDGETIESDLYGRLPAMRVAILVHGQNWDASGWRRVAPPFVPRGRPGLG